MMTRAFLFFFFLALLPVSLVAQSDDDLPLAITEATSIGAGGYNLMDTYLTPGIEARYGGWGLSVANERMKLTGLLEGRISRQQWFRAEFARTFNGAETKSEMELAGEYALNYHYRFEPLPRLRLLAGGGARGLVGMIYNVNNGNNPVSVKADLDLNLSAILLYELQLKNYPITLRYQVDLPFSGLCFAPKYGQSYYEAFDLENAGGVVHFNSFHNKFAIRNYLTADFPFRRFTIRLAFHHQAYHTDMNGIRAHIVSRSFMLGFVREFFSWGGKRGERERLRFRSAYY